MFVGAHSRAGIRAQCVHTRKCVPVPACTRVLMRACRITSPAGAELSDDGKLRGINGRISDANVARRAGVRRMGCHFVESYYSRQRDKKGKWAT